MSFSSVLSFCTRSSISPLHLQMSNRMLVLVGLPGSGKTTISTELEKLKSWKRINQDDMKSRKACEMFTRKSLDQKANVVIDRCNFDPSQRKTWVDLAHHYKIPVDCVVLTANQEECGGRITVRENHPTKVMGEEGLKVLNSFVKNYKPPKEGNISEGFDRILYLDPSPNPICTEERLDEMMALLDKIEPVTTRSKEPKEPKQKITVDEEGWSTIPITNTINKS